ncbi:L-seryl-tRNA(Sec) selenium transferase [Streptomyces albicerus]|uniref:L-seryl-tRNA(Sec) selenium transferase n=1 Tax=Streptomyces albicerus TaxID=2569859 RepID=UPI00124B209E
MRCEGLGGDVSTDQTRDRRRGVPRTDAVLRDPRLVAAVDTLGRAAVKDVVALAQERVRRGEILPDSVADVAAASLPRHATTLRPVVNATGVVLHTNLGRAPLSAAAVDALRAAAGTTDIEFDLATGQRARRGRGALEALAAAVPAAEAVHVVNNGAAALVLVATALATGRDIVVSRGELIEIGDGFRLPDLLESTGARLREVGTTNRTSLRDYAAVIGPDTGFVLKVHPSNFVVRGFTSAVATRDLAGLDVPVVVDIGSGLLAPEPLLRDEPDATTGLGDGAALVTASGDKLLGGPQAGLLLGRAAIVARLRRHPLARALRVDKLTLAALEATLRGPQSPTWQALHRHGPDLRSRAYELSAALRDHGVAAEAVGTASVVGGGGAPDVTLPSWAVALSPALTSPLRAGELSVVGRVERGQLLLDLRCAPPDQDETLRTAVLSAARDRQA